MGGEGGGGEGLCVGFWGVELLLHRRREWRGEVMVLLRNLGEGEVMSFLH